MKMIILRFLKFIVLIVFVSTLSSQNEIGSLVGIKSEFDEYGKIKYFFTKYDIQEDKMWNTNATVENEMVSEDLQVRTSIDYKKGIYYHSVTRTLQGNNHHHFTGISLNEEKILYNCKFSITENGESVGFLQYSEKHDKLYYLSSETNRTSFKTKTLLGYVDPDTCEKKIVLEIPNYGFRNFNNGFGFQKDSESIIFSSYKYQNEPFIIIINLNDLKFNVIDTKEILNKEMGTIKTILCYEKSSICYFYTEDNIKKGKNRQLYQLTIYSNELDFIMNLNEKQWVQTDVGKLKYDGYNSIITFEEDEAGNSYIRVYNANDYQRTFNPLFSKKVENGRQFLRGIKYID